MFIVTTNNDFFKLIGCYSTIKRARKALEYFFQENEAIVSFQDIGSYTYMFTTAQNKVFYADIWFSEVDFEFNAHFLDD